MRRNRPSKKPVNLLYPVYPTPNAIEISSGGGLFSLAAEIEGVDVQVHCEIEKHPVATLRHNIDQTIVTCDIKELDVEAGPEGLDLFMGGPPCQPWSKGRSLGAKGVPLGADDPRNLWVHMTRLIEALRPRVVLLENVYGILDRKHLAALGRPGEKIPGSWWEEVEALGYEGVIYGLNAADYGTPQNRQRVWMVLWPVGAPWGPQLREPPPATHYDPRRPSPDPRMRPWVTSYQRLQGGCCQGYGLVTCAFLNNADNVCNGCINGESFRLAPNEEGGGARLTPEQAARLFEEAKKGTGITRISKWKPHDAGGVMFDAMKSGAPTGGYLSPTLSKTLLSKQPGTRAATIEGPGYLDVSCPVDEDAARLRQLSVREAAKLQDVPQWYEFKGSMTSQYEQIGNGISVNMGRAVLRHALQALRPRTPSPAPGTLAAQQTSREDYTGLWPFGLGVTGCRSVIPISPERLAEAGYREGRKGREAARRTFRGGDPNRERRMVDALVSALDELAQDDAFVDPDEPWDLDEFAHVLPRFTQEGADYGVPSEDALRAALKRSASWRAVSSPYGPRWKLA